MKAAARDANAEARSLADCTGLDVLCSADRLAALGQALERITPTGSASTEVYALRNGIRGLCATVGPQLGQNTGLSGEKEDPVLKANIRRCVGIYNSLIGKLQDVGDKSDRAKSEGGTAR